MQRQPGPGARGARAGGTEVHVVDRALAVQIHQVDERAADALDARDVEFHGAGALRAGLGTEAQGAPVGRRGVAHAKRHGAGRGAVGAREPLREGFGLGVDDEVDLALAVQRDVLGAVLRDRGETEPLEQRAQQLRVGRGVFDELESVRAHGVVVQVAHGVTFQVRDSAYGAGGHYSGPRRQRRRCADGGMYNRVPQSAPRRLLQNMRHAPPTRLVFPAG